MDESSFFSICPLIIRLVQSTWKEPKCLIPSSWYRGWDYSLLPRNYACFS